MAQLKLDYIDCWQRDKSSHTACLRNSPATSLVTYQSPHWPPDSFSPYSRVLALHFKVHTSILAPLYLNSQAAPVHRLPSLQLFLSWACSAWRQVDRKASCRLSLSTRDSCLSRQDEGSRKKTLIRTEMVVVMPTTDPMGYRVHWSFLPHIAKSGLHCLWGLLTPLSAGGTGCLQEGRNPSEIKGALCCVLKVKTQGTKAILNTLPPRGAPPLLSPPPPPPLPSLPNVFLNFLLNALQVLLCLFSRYKSGMFFSLFTYLWNAS